MITSKFLAVILFHNDEEIVNEQIKHMIANKHDIIIFNHNSNDHTQTLIESAQEKHTEIKKIYVLDENISFSSGEVFKYISDVLIADYKNDYEWISFIESDEFLEGPTRDKSYYDCLLYVSKTDYTYVEFNNMLFWFTDNDNQEIKNVRERVKYYSWFYNCGPRIYAWKAEYTNDRKWNHNCPSVARKFPINFNTCHYPFTSKSKYIEKLETRKKATNGETNYHYVKLHDNREKILGLKMHEHLHYDDGSDLKLTKHYNWKKDIY